MVITCSFLRFLIGCCFLASSSLLQFQNRGVNGSIDLEEGRMRRRRCTRWPIGYIIYCIFSSCQQLLTVMNNSSLASLLHSEDEPLGHSRNQDCYSFDRLTLLVECLLARWSRTRVTWPQISTTISVVETSNAVE